MANEKQALAINGGTPAIQGSLPVRGHFGAAEKAAADRVMDEAIQNGVAPGYGGPEEDALCKEFAELLGGGYADAVNSGSTSVFVALRAVDPEPFSEVIVGPVTDPGGMMPIVMANCIPVVADSEPGTFNISLEGIKRVVSERTSAIIVAHIAGEPVDMEAICAFAKERGIAVVEDCAQAHGASIGGKPVGTFGDVAAFSMMFGKHTCTGGQGGLVFTKNEDIYWRVRQNSDRGKPFGLPEGSTNCLASLNFNLDEMGCAIGRVQIQKMFPIAKARRAVIEKLTRALSDIPCLKPTPIVAGGEPSYWFFRLLFDADKIHCTKKEFCDALTAEGLFANSYYAATPYTSDWYQKRRVFGTSGYPWAAPEYKGDRDKKYTLDDVPNAKKALDDTIIIYPIETWTDETIAQVSAAFHKVADAFAK